MLPSDVFEYGMYKLAMIIIHMKLNVVIVYTLRARCLNSVILDAIGWVSVISGVFSV